MKTILNLPDGIFEDLMSHLLPADSSREEAAFMFVTTNRQKAQTSFDLIETRKMLPEDFESQMDNYFELKDVARAGLIKRAHDLDASLVELHSHPSPYPAAFSLADNTGLKETVPHMWWRLSKRPYLAIVVAPRGFDALVWIDNPNVPQALDGLHTGGRLLRPTNNSIGDWQ